MVVWTSDGQDGDLNGVFGQRYDSSGVAKGDEFQVNSYTTSEQWFPTVASDQTGNFVVAWASYQDGSGTGVFGQRYDNEGVPQGAEFQTNSYTPDAQALPAIASDDTGNVVVVWASYQQDGSSFGIFGQRYDSGGMPQGAEFRINSHTSDRQQSPSIGVTGINQFAVAWESLGQDGSSYGVFGQRFDFSGDTPTIHAGDLDRRAKNVGATWRAQVKTLVHDDGESPVNGVLVTLDVSGVGTRTCTTTPAGNCEVSVVVSDNVPSLTFTVANLSKAGFSYDAGANHDPDSDSNGTTIVVNQP